MERLWFHPVDNPNLLAYTKNSADRTDIVLTVVNFDYEGAQVGVVQLDIAGLGLPDNRPYEVIDLVDGSRTRWTGGSIPFEFDPAERSSYVLWLRR